jgi:hypothetical protein
MGIRKKYILRRSSWLLVVAAALLLARMVFDRRLLSAQTNYETTGPRWKKSPPVG